MRQQRTVLMLLARYNHPFHLGISRYAGEHRWHLGASFTSTGILPHGWRGDGVLTTLNQNPHLLAFLRRLHVPVVDLLIQRPDVALPRVVGDNEAIGRIAAEHFLDRGFQSFAWYSDEFTNVERLRLKGFQDRLAPLGVSCAPLIWCQQRGARKSGEWRDQRIWIGRQLRALPKPLALLAFSDYDAATVLDACGTAGLQVPDEVAVLGVNNSELVCNCLPVPLSSVNHDMERIGYEGAALLDRLMDGAPAPAEPILIRPRGITLRQSTDILAVNQPQVRTALKFLRENFQRSIGTSEAAAATGVPRRALEKLFRQHLRRTVHEELLRVRVQHARELLLHSNHSSAEIAQACGFCHPQHFNNVFRQLEGHTPHRYRAAHAVPGRMTSPGSKPR